MVFHITNYMRETNVWMIRKMRWILWGGVLATPVFRVTYWDMLGRRQAWRSHWFGGSEEQQKARAESLVGDWGYHPRYEPVYAHSMKNRKYASQTPEETLNDHPRLSPTGNMKSKRGLVPGKDIRSLV